MSGLIASASLELQYFRLPFSLKHTIDTTRTNKQGLRMRLLKEPLLHFLVLGALLFGAWSRMNHNRQFSAAAQQVRIGPGDVAWLKETWARQWQREPTRDELRGLVMDYLREELLAREARAMGLEENDTIVRRRLAQKLEFLLQDTARLAEPIEDDLHKFYLANPERFQTAPRISFTQVFFSRQQRTDAASDAKDALTRLSTPGADASELGDRSLLDFEFRDSDSQTVTAQFGNEFANAVFAQAAGAWHGPLESPYGLHLVRVLEVKPGHQLDFSEVKSQILERWRDERQREQNEKYVAGLLRKYDVVLDDSVKPIVGPLASGKKTQ
jgi:hypothetical protein